MAISFDGRVAIVTGAGGGIGRTHALEIGRRGGKVLVNDLGCNVAGQGGSPAMAEAVAGEVCAAGGAAIANWDSVASTAGANRMAAQAIEAFGRIDILINNAGNMRPAYIEDMSDEDWDAVIGTQLTGSFKLIRAVWPQMKRQRYGRIVNTCSSAGMFGTTLLANYGAAKAGIAGLTNVAALEGEPYGILCNALMPNAMTRMAIETASHWEAEGEADAMEMPPEVGNSMNPEFNASLGVYLASEECKSTKGLWSQCLGRAARVFIGVTPGWQAQRQSAPGIDEIAAHWAEIGDTARGFAMPPTPRDELGLVLGQGG